MQHHTGGGVPPHDLTMPSPSHHPQHLHPQQHIIYPKSQNPTHYQTTHTTELEKKIHSLQDSLLKDEIKLKTLQEIWSQLENVYTFPVYEKVVDRLVQSFIHLFCSTAPQFIAENNTLMLRKLALEVLLRVSTVDTVKLHTRELSKQMMRLVAVENEDNAILAIKIIIDLGRVGGKMQYCNEVSVAMAFFKKMMLEITNLATTTSMFVVRDANKVPDKYGEEALIAEYLNTCFHTQLITLSGQDRYNLIPMSSRSVRVLQEIPMLVVFFYQHYKNSIQTEALDFMRYGFDFLNVRIPRETTDNLNQALADNFVVTQAKFLAFVNIMGKVPLFNETILHQGSLLATGVLQLLDQCPADLIPTRKDVLITLKFLTSGDTRVKFLDFLPRMLSETAILGTGFTSIDNLRTFMYQMLADLLHHMRNQLNYEMLAHVSYIFCRQLHDTSTNTQVQIMSARLLNSVTECMTKWEQNNEPTRDLLLNILESMITKLKVLAVYHLPALFKQFGNEVDYEYRPPERQKEKPASSTATVASSAPTSEKPATFPNEAGDKFKQRERRLSVDSVREMDLLADNPTTSYIVDPPPPLPTPTVGEDKTLSSPEAILNSLFCHNAPPVSLIDGRNLVKFILQTCKFVTGQLKDTKPTVNSCHRARERDMFERLLKYGIMCMDVFVIPIGKQPAAPTSGTRSKDEKDTLESLANVFTTIDHGVFRELFEKYMDFLIERIFKNYPLQLMVNTFLVRNEVPFFASIMLKYLMGKMHCLANNNEKTALYVKLFKIIFSAIGTHQPNVEGEKMLKPFLPDLIRQATVMALSAREPLNYFLLLRALFRSIGGGAHDILYGKFLPLLPNLLQFLNKLQSCQHRPQMRELFVELCLTVPVRLSSLLPYLPLLMDPLVCALNGSHGLVQQGLRTLELCVDNLQPEYLFEHMAPVRGALMQGLWKVVGSSNDASSVAAAFRILGKFGGANRKMLNEPQILQVAEFSEVCQSYVNMEFSKMGFDGNLSIHLPLSDVMKIAVEQMKVGTIPAETIGQVGVMTPPQLPSLHLRKQCMELARSVLLTGLGPCVVYTSEEIKALNLHVRKAFMAFNPSDKPKKVYKCGRENDRELFINALLVLFYGVISKDGLRHQYLKFFNAVLRQLSLIGILEFSSGTGWLQHAEEEGVRNLCMDASVLVDALVAAFSDSNKDFCFSAMVALRHINDTCAAALVDINMMSQVPFCRYLIERIMKLCHGPSWFARLGGASALSYMIDNYPKRFIEDNLPALIVNLLEAILGTVDEIASGSADKAMESLERLQRIMLKPSEDEDEEMKRLGFVDLFVTEFAKYYFHGHHEVRKRMKSLLKQCWEISKVEEEYNGFVNKYKEHFIEDIKRTMNTAQFMSLADATASLSAIYDFMTIQPPIYDFEQDQEIWKKFQTYVLEIAQKDSELLLQRQLFKKCETCADHFLPPYPIIEQIDLLRAHALRCLVATYTIVRNRRDQKEESYDESSRDTAEIMESVRSEIALDSEYMEFNEVFDEANPAYITRILTITVRAAMDLSQDEMSRGVHEALCEISPLPLNAILLIGGDILKRILDQPENEFKVYNDDDDDEYDFELNSSERKKLAVEDVVRLTRLVDFNPKVLKRKIMQNLTNYAIRFKIDKRGSANRRDSDEAEDEKVAFYRRQNWRDADAVGMIVLLLANCKDPDMVGPGMAVSLARFASRFEYNFTQDLLPHWVPDVAKFMGRFPKAIMEFMFCKESLSDPAVRSFFRRIIVYPETLPLRKELMENSAWTAMALDAKYLDIDDNVWKPLKCTEALMCDREMYILHLIDSISRLHLEWFASPNSPIDLLKERFKDPEFKKRYFVRSPTEDDSKVIVVKSLTEHKYKVPKLIVNCFLRYLRMNHLDFELYFDVITVFIGNYVTDFFYVREFFENEVIPIMPAEWRREAFIRIMKKFEDSPDTAVTDFGVVKVMQYMINPCLQWWFERYPVDEIVGAHQADENEDDPANLVSILAKVVDKHRLRMSDGMVIVFYQLCSLFVQHASHHIHNNSYKKQGGRLRIFMLFAWPCLTVQCNQDPTMRYAGFLFLANIIKNFTINRKIVLQVYASLTQSYQQDNREQIRRALDLLTPAVPQRMEDGPQQMFTMVKKVLIEDCHNLAHIQHILNLVIRNWRVFYHVKNDLLTPLMNAVQRAIIMPNSVNDAWVSRKAAVDVGEICLKWELLRSIRSAEETQTISDEEAQEVEKVLERLKAPPNEKDNWEECGFFKPRDNEDKNVISKDHIDQIVNILIRFACTMNQPQAHASSSELVKRCHGLLRVALRSFIWGEVVTIRSSSIEKLVTFPPEMSTLRQEGGQSSQITSQISQSQSGLEVIGTMVTVMPKHVLLNALRPLQRAIISCLNSSVGQLIRSVNNLVSKMFEKMRSTAQGLEEVEILNQYIVKFLNDNFNTSLKNPAAQITQIYTGMSLLKIIIQYQPGYMDATCLNTFYKITERTSKDLLQCEPAREKGMTELVCFALELLKMKVETFSHEMRKAVASNILADLVLRANSEKLFDAVLKVVGCLINPDDLDFGYQTALPLLYRAQNVIEKRFRNSKDIMNNFLAIVLRVYECSDFRNHEAGKKLWDGFFWGLTSSDAEIREKFLASWESTWPHLATIDMTQRMKFILQNQDWSKFKQFFWLRHALWCMLRCVSTKGREREQNVGMDSRRKKVRMLNCASPWQTFEITTQMRTSSLTMNPEEMAPTPQNAPSQDEAGEPMDTSEGGDALPPPAEAPALSGYEQRLKLLLDEQTPLLEEAAQFDFAQSIESVAHIAFGINDTKFVSNMWIMLFKSFWASLSQDETYEFNAMIRPFMSSASHNSYISGKEKSVLAVWLDAVSHVVQLPSHVIEYVSSRHECWHTGIKLLENSAYYIPKQIDRSLLSLPAVPLNDQKDLDILESLATLYNEISEFDQYATIWNKRALTPETVKAMDFMQLGDMEAASEVLEGRMCQVYSSMVPNMIRSANGNVINDENIKTIMDFEYDVWMDMYITCCSELRQWQFVADLSNSKEMQYPMGLIRAAMHIPDWNVVEECRSQIAGCIPPRFYPDYTIYNMMVTMMKNSDNSTPAQHKEKIKAAVQEAMETHIAKWRALPSVATYSHAKILQSMHIIREVEESMDLRCSLEEPVNKFETNVLQEMKALIKIWRSRAPTTSDEMSFVSTVYDWRVQIHTLVLNRFDDWDRLGMNLPLNATNHSILPIHSAAQGTLAVAKTARSLGYYNMAKDVLNRMATITAIPMIDAHNKVCDYSKTLRNMALATQNEDLRKEILLEGLEVLEDVKIDELSKDQITRLFYQRGNLHSLLDQDHHAGLAFTQAAQMVDFKMSQVTPGTINLMKTWGHHQYKLFFTSTVTPETANIHGRQALVCYFVAARVDSEQKAKKHIAKILWLAKHLSVCGQESSEALNRIVKSQLHSLNLFNWVYFLPQLITEVRHRQDSMFIHIIIKLIPTFSMQVYYHLRENMPVSLIDRMLETQADNVTDDQSDLPDETAYAKDDPLIRILMLVLRYRPTDIRVFHRILAEIDQMAEFWVERHLRYALHLKDLIFADLGKKMNAAFNDVRLSNDALKLMNEWKKQLKEDLEYYENNYHLSNEQIAKNRKFEVRKGYLGGKRAKILFEKEVPRQSDDAIHPVDEYKSVYDDSTAMIQNLSLSGDAIRPMRFLEMVIAWIKSLRGRILTLPKKVPLGATSAYLSRFSNRNGCVEMPFDLLNVIRVKNHNSPTTNQSGQYVSMIARFEPLIEVSVRGGELLRRFNIRGQTGKACSFYQRRSVRREKTSRVSQVFSYFNNLLQKDRETARRHLHVPMCTQLRTSHYSTILEIAAIQPYAHPLDNGTINPAANVEIIHPLDILEQSLAESNLIADDIVYMFYDRFSQSADSIGPAPPKLLQSTSDGTSLVQHHTQPHHIQHIIYEDFVRDNVPNRILYDYMMMRYPDNTTYYMLRKQIVHCLAVMSVVESHCVLTPLGLDQIMITANTGALFNPKYLFELAPDGTKLADVNFNMMRHEVPFRLTPNFDVLVGIAREGDLMWSMAATAKCLFKRNADIIMRPLLWDEYLDNLKPENEISSREMGDPHYEQATSSATREAGVRLERDLNMCHNANSHVVGVVKNLEKTNSSSAKLLRHDVLTQINWARNSDNLARMPPTYHPWF